MPVLKYWAVLVDIAFTLAITIPPRLLSVKRLSLSEKRHFDSDRSISHSCVCHLSVLTLHLH